MVTLCDAGNTFYKVILSSANGFNGFKSYIATVLFSTDMLLTIAQVMPYFLFPQGKKGPNMNFHHMANPVTFP